MPNKRTFSDENLVHHLPLATSMNDLVGRLTDGRSGSSYVTTVLARVAALGLDVSHLKSHMTPIECTTEPRPRDPGSLSSGAEHLAAAWYTLHGFTVSWPLRVAKYDLMAEDGCVLRVQVKSATQRDEFGRWVVQPRSASGRSAVTSYAHGEVDEFFIVTEDLRLFRLPSELVAGKMSITQTEPVAGSADLTNIRPGYSWAIFSPALVQSIPS